MVFLGALSYSLLEKQQFSHLYTNIFVPPQGSESNILGILGRDGETFRSNAPEIQAKLIGKNILLDNPESRRLKKKRTVKCTTNVLRSKERRWADKQTIADLTYEKMLPLNTLWEGYMKDLYSVTQKVNLENSLLRADYHGSFLRVVQSKCPSFVGKSGIVVQETLHTFVLMPTDSRPIGTLASA